MPVIESLLAGKAFDIAFNAAGGAVKAFFKQDSMGRLLVLLHADFGAESDLERDIFYSWRANQPLADALGEVLSGARGAEPEQLATLAALIEPRLVRTSEPERAALAARIANAAVRAAPLTVGGEDTLLLVNRLESGQQRIAEALGASDSKSTPGLAAALIVGPLRHVAAVQELTAAERRAESGEPAEAAGEMLAIVERLQREGLRSAAETLGERAATLLASAGERGRAVEVLIAIVRARVARGERWGAEQSLTLIESLQGDEEWIAPGLRAQITWPEHGEGDLPALAAAAEGSAGREDHADWLAAHTGLLLLFGRSQEVIDASTALAGSARLAGGGRLAVELDRLDALEALGSEREAQEGWLALLRWVDREAELEERGIAWQRRGLALAAREHVSGAEDAYRRAMDCWAGTPGYEEQAGEAFLSLQAAYMLNGRVELPDAELRALAWRLRGGPDTPVARAERLSSEAMSNRLVGRLPDALYGYWRAYAISRASGSLVGLTASAAALAELYGHAGQHTQAMRFHVSAGNGKAAAEAIAGLYPPGLLAAELALDTPRWQRAAAYHVIGEHGASLPLEQAAAIAPRVLAEACGAPDGVLEPQPVHAARRALASIALALPAEHRQNGLAQLTRQLEGNYPNVVQGSARALILATNAGVGDFTTVLLGAFLRDGAITGISSFWIAERALLDEGVRKPLREAALGGHLGALEALAVADLLDGDEQLLAACAQVVENAAGAEGVSEVSDGETLTISVGLGMNLETPGIFARVAPAELSGRLLERMLTLLCDPREPEGNRASAAGALYNLAPALDEDQAASATAALGPLALGRYDPSRWDKNVGNALTRFQVTLHIPHVLRSTALSCIAQLHARHSNLERDHLQQAIGAALADAVPAVLAAGLQAGTLVPELALPFPPEAWLAHPDQRVRGAALSAWAVRNEGVPEDELLELLRSDHSVAVRLDLVGIAVTAGEQSLLRWFAASDPDAYVRAIAARRLREASGAEGA
ncbi:MAG: hypothetical protein ACLQBB_15320 [Solirubrobacteraceae bacterium]